MPGASYGYACHRIEPSERCTNCETQRVGAVSTVAARLAHSLVSTRLCASEASSGALDVKPDPSARCLGARTRLSDRQIAPPISRSFPLICSTASSRGPIEQHAQTLLTEMQTGQLSTLAAAAARCCWWISSRKPAGRRAKISHADAGPLYGSRDDSTMAAEMIVAV
ncbi:hypothetical protein OPT61_g8665 [Boeremia exigua]|uniref:Uncharacterized protein n=1 Tax=Boeremia exigua TaxID=749465 RepID=A0ACC2HYF9_9PLEO|nr:hypothetical protein OPT61_g8665 [Boeremia exigua]